MLSLFLISVLLCPPLVSEGDLGMGVMEAVRELRDRGGEGVAEEEERECLMGLVVDASGREEVRGRADDGGFLSFSLSHPWLVSKYFCCIRFR